MILPLGAPTAWSIWMLSFPWNPFNDGINIHAARQRPDRFMAGALGVYPSGSFHIIQHMLQENGNIGVLYYIVPNSTLTKQGA